ncbi:DUF6049 family protein [Cellulomonas oligotrophica]|uniref:Glycoprotein n=1 Tax=Cellulomonas oligotrophica TaxID=931536 RepID=A0A7Y9FG13_9CELL|nr:DUF6049 family protein [Cellulomonas oligotrophica]NYD86635.1 hypothetical protein [Cellulomonas oligotrophica]GIG34386.1 hypothetical protein Col01nite_35450 [Cellulomonas oligotrophica]
MTPTPSVRRRPTALRLLAGAAVLAVGLLGAAAPAQPASATTAGTAAASTTRALPVTVQVLDVAPTVLRPGQDLVVRVRLTNDGTTTIERPGATVRIERIRPGTRAELQAWLDSPTDAGGRVGAYVSAATSDVPLAPGAQTELVATVRAQDVGLLDRPDVWGARGLAVEATDGGTRVGLQRTFVLWAPEGQYTQARVSVVAPVVGAATVPDGVDVDAPGPTAADLTAPDGRLTTLLDAVRPFDDVALAVDPALLADVAKPPAGDETPPAPDDDATAGPTQEPTATGPAGTAAPGDDATPDPGDGSDDPVPGVSPAWADDLRSLAAGRDVVALPWSDPDLAALAHAGDTGLLTAATDATSAGVDALGLTGARTDVLLAPGPSTDQPTAELAAEAGAEVLVTAAGDLAATGDVTVGARSEVTTGTGTLTALTPDPVLSQLLTDPTVLDPAATSATALARTLAELSVIARAGTLAPPHVLVTTPRAWEADPDLVAAVLTGVQEAPWSRTTPLTALLGTTSGTEQRTPLPVSTTAETELGPEQVRRLDDARSAAIDFAQVSDDATDLLAGLDEAVLAPLSVAWRSDVGARQTLVDGVVAAVDARRTGLSIAPLSTQRIISASGDLRFSVRNELDVPASVRIVASPRKACLRTEPSELVTLEPGAEQVVPVPLHAVANCEVQVEAVVTTSAGTPVSPTLTFQASVTPTIESVGTAVVGVLLLVGLVLGIVRTVRRGQSARRGARLVHESDARSLPVLGGIPEDEK